MEAKKINIFDNKEIAVKTLRKYGYKIINKEIILKGPWSKLELELVDYLCQEHNYRYRMQDVVN